MNKRILCLLMCLLMVVSVFAGCAQKDDDAAVEDINEEASESALTLSMYLMSENKMSQEQMDAIETAANRLTKSKFKTQLELSFFTEDEYYEKLEASFAARAEAEAAGLIQTTDEEESTEEETFENEWGVSEIKYPTIEGYQVDIFYMGGYDRFTKYLDMGMLSNLNDEVASASKKLSSFIAKPYMDYMKSINNKIIYAVPTNAAIGEYTYLLVNKEALEKTHYDTDNGLKYFTGITDASVKNFLSQVGDHGYTEIYFDNTKLDYVDLASAGVQYWGVDENGQLKDDFSLIASNVPTTGKYFADMGNVFNTKFKLNLETITEYADNGYFGTLEQFKNGEVAVAYVKGGAEIPEQYAAHYEAIVIDTPEIKTADIYNNMFAVTSYTTSLARSMEIVTFLNTDEEFRNLLLYGIEGENYELVNTTFEDEEGNPLTDRNGDVYKVVRRINEDYMMDINKTGNTLITYSLEGENPTLKEYIKQQNIDSTASYLMGFTLTYNDYIVNAEYLASLKALSAEARAKLNEFITDEDKLDSENKPIALADVISEINTTFKDEEAFLGLLNIEEPADAEEPCSLYFLYNQWADAQGIIPKEEF